MGPRHESVLGYFRRAGVEPVRFGSESADHVGLEIAFLGLLAERMCAGEDLSGSFAAFWVDHVAPWMPAFASRLAGEARVPLYRAVGQLLGLGVSASPKT
jgi:TorA maturation chaperone TorD